MFFATPTWCAWMLSLGSISGRHDSRNLRDGDVRNFQAGTASVVVLEMARSSPKGGAATGGSGVGQSKTGAATGGGSPPASQYNR